MLKLLWKGEGCELAEATANEISKLEEQRLTF